MSHHILDFCHNNFFLVAPMALLVNFFGLPSEETFPKVYTFAPPPPPIYCSQRRAKCTKYVGTHKF